MVWSKYKTTDYNKQYIVTKQIHWSSRSHSPQSISRSNTSAMSADRTNQHKEARTRTGTKDDSDIWEGILKFFSILLIIVTCPISLSFCLKTVKEYERAVIFRLGRVKTGGVVGPGIFFIIPCMDSVTVVDLRTVSFDVPAQEILTRNSVTAQLGAFCCNC